MEVRLIGCSNQLQRPNDKNILKATRKGNKFFYRVTDTCVSDLIHLGLCLNEQSVNSDDES